MILLYTTLLIDDRKYAVLTHVRQHISCQTCMHAFLLALLCVLINIVCTMMASFVHWIFRFYVLHGFCFLNNYLGFLKNYHDLKVLGNFANLLIRALINQEVTVDCSWHHLNLVNCWGVLNFHSQHTCERNLFLFKFNVNCHKEVYLVQVCYSFEQSGRKTQHTELQQFLRHSQIWTNYQTLPFCKI